MNAAFEIRALVEYLQWHPDKLKREGDVYLGLCPIHRDTIFRTLVLNPRNNTYHCRHMACPGHAPADFLDLLCRVRGESLPTAMLHAAAHFGQEYFRLSDSQLRILRELAAAG